MWHASMLTSSLLVSATRMSVVQFRRLENARARSIAVYRADIKSILQISQYLIIVVDDGYVVRFLAER